MDYGTCVLLDPTNVTSTYQIFIFRELSDILSKQNDPCQCFEKTNFLGSVISHLVENTVSL